MDDSPTNPIKPKVRKSRVKTPPTGATPNGIKPLPTTSTAPGPEASGQPPANALPVQETIGVKERISDKINPLKTEEIISEFNIDIGQSSIVLIAIFDGLAAILFGNEARLNATEKQLINDPLERILKRMTPDVSKAVNQWGDFIMLTMGLVAWGSRIVRLQREKAIQTPPITRTTPPEGTPEKQPPGPPPPFVADLAIGDLTSAPAIIAAQVYGESL